MRTQMKFQDVALRDAGETDAVAISGLAVLVFLHTYAAEGVRPDLAREALSEYSESAFASRLRDSHRRFVLAEGPGGLLGFAEAQLSSHRAPGCSLAGAELVRLYVHPRAQQAGIGRRLLLRAEQLSSSALLSHLWLTAWEGNVIALTFYRCLGYSVVASTSYTFQGNTYRNEVLAKPLRDAQPAP